MRKIKGIPDLKELYINQRMSAVKISEMFGVNPSVIYRRLREQGIIVKNRKFIITDWNKLANLYVSGISLADIAREFNCSESAIKTRIYDKLKLPRRKLPPNTFGSYREAFIFRRYGISKKQYEELLKKQNGKCAICCAKPNKTGRSSNRLHIDHKGKKVRGLLCGPCNTGIGLFKDSPKLLTRAIQYLRRNQ